MGDKRTTREATYLLVLGVQARDRKEDAGTSRDIMITKHQDEARAAIRKVALGVREELTGQILGLIDEARREERAACVAICQERLNKMTSDKDLTDEKIESKEWNTVRGILCEIQERS